MSVIGKNYGKPTLDLNFAGNKSLIDTTTGRNYVTFSRAQSGNEATYVGSDGLIKYASADEPRFDHDPVTGDTLGLLVEESRTNYRSYSSIPTVEYTSFQNKVTIVDAKHLAPDGTASAISVTNNTGVNDQYCWSYFTDYASIPTTGYLCASIFVKMISGNEIEVKGEVGNQGWIGFAGVRVDFSTPIPTVTLLGASGQNAIDGGVIPYPNNWWRVWFVVNTADGTFNTGATRGPGVVPRIAGTSAYIWGAQIEAGSYPNSYIPTSGSTETRAADEASITGSNFSSWYNQNEGTLLTTADYNGNNPSNYNMIVEGYSGLSARDFSCGINASNPNFTTRYSFTSLDLIPAGGPIPTKTAFKLVGSYSADGSAAVFNGGLVQTTGATTSVLTPADAMSIGRRVGSSLFLNGHISRLTYYPKRLPDIELQQLTK